MLETIQDSLLSLTFPQKCLTCSEQVSRLADGAACSECWDSTRLFDRTEMLCEKCGSFFGDKAAPSPVYCHQCDKHHYDRAVAIGIYERALTATVIHLKASPHLPARIRERIGSIVEEIAVFKSDVVIPVPLSIQRYNERGFNQAAVIAKAVAHAAGIPVDPASLARLTHTPSHRVGMDKKARELTVKNAFAVTRPRLIYGRRVLLVDDVFTSGSTASACSRVLKKNGAKEVNVFTIARAVLR